jgi:hypothetical protein
MKHWHKGILLGVIHLLIVASLGAKLLYDRATRPRAWVRAAPYDPDLPIRGRYVSLQLEPRVVDIAPPEGEPDPARPWNDPILNRRVPAILSVEGDQLVARHDPSATAEDSYDWSRDAVSFRRLRDRSVVVILANPVLFFIPEHVQDPSLRAPGEELWVEVTLPRKGPPRPIRLAAKKDGVLTPLNLD